nr:hypothetical protein [Citrobacter koseri]
MSMVVAITGPFEINEAVIQLVPVDMINGLVCARQERTRNQRMNRFGFALAITVEVNQCVAAICNLLGYDFYWRLAVCLFSVSQ